VDPLPLFLPAEAFTPGANFAHEQRCPGVGNLVISTPISAMMTAAATGPMRELIESHRVRGERGQVRLDLGVQGGDVGVDPVDSGEHFGQKEPVVVVEVPGQSLPQLRDLAPHPTPGHVRENRGVAFPGDQGSHRLRPETPKIGRRWRPPTA
jgi:hypothetical protein